MILGITPVKFVKIYKFNNFYGGVIRSLVLCPIFEQMHVQYDLALLYRLVGIFALSPKA